MADTCPQLSLCWAFACLVGQDKFSLSHSVCKNLMCGSALEGNIYCLVSAPHSVSSCARASLWWHHQPQSGEDSLFQELLSGPSSPVGLLPAGMEALNCGFISLGTVCCFSAEAEQFRGSAVSQKKAEGFGHRAHWPQVGPFPSLCLDSANLFHSPQFTYVSSQS